MPEIGKFQKLQTDMGREFLNHPFQTWLKQHHVEHFYTQNFDTKASIAERFIRTLKEKLWHYFTYTNSRRYPSRRISKIIKDISLRFIFVLSLYHS